MSYKDTIGLHLRLAGSLDNLPKQALDLGLKTFQFFLIPEKMKRHITLQPEELKAFLDMRQYFNQLFIHSSYWINPSSSKKQVISISKGLLKREIEMAQKLEVDYLVLHAGSAKGYPPDHNDPSGIKRGIIALARLLNSILKDTKDITLLIENSAHGKSTICSDLGHFSLLKNELDYPEKVNFCLDTAHAFAYGYNLEALDEFIVDLDRTMGLEKIKLIHFNDSYDAFGSMQDRHAFPGRGVIGNTILKNILNHESFKDIPKIIESPEESFEKTQENLDLIYSWLIN